MLAGLDAARSYTEIEQRNMRAVIDGLPYWNAHDIPGILNFYHDDVVWRNVAMEETYAGKQEVSDYLHRLLVALPDMTFDVTYAVAAGDNLYEKWTVTGTHLGTFWGVPPTGRRVEIRAVSLVEMRDGKYVSDEFYFDTGVVLRQIGLMPPLTVTNGRAGQMVLWAMVHRKRVGILAGVAAAMLTARRFNPLHGAHGG
jgi:steroid delta-isomerase-like uncharacterized protein